MKIAVFDIDDTITFETEYLKKCAPAFLRKHSLESMPVNPNGYNLNETYGIEEQLINSSLSYDDAVTKAKKITNQFWNQNFIKYNCLKVRPGVSDFIYQLKKYGYEVHFLSLRGKKTSEKETGFNRFIRIHIVPFITKLMLRKNKVYYDKLVMVQNENEKLEYIKFYYPDIIFEDQASIIEKVYHYDKKIHRVCVSVCHNENTILPDETVRIFDYKQDESILTDIIDKRTALIKRMSLKNRIINIFQSIVKDLGQWYFLVKFRPVIYGKENIPKKGGVVFVGNHRNKLNPVFVAISSGKNIHWAALLRMFQGKEDLFSLNSGRLKRELSAKFITAMGALPIARPTDENYEEINLKTISELTEILNMKGTVGFFPEGTINRKPDENNILPLKSNRVFRMAVETDSYVQPFSIVWVPEELKTKNRLFIVYSKPINTYNRNKKDVKDIWWEIVNRNIDFVNKLKL